MLKMTTAEAVQAEPQSAATAAAAAAAATQDMAGERAPLGAPAQLEPVSLAGSEHSERSASTDSDYGDSDEGAEPVKCSAVHTLERDMPSGDYSHLVLQLRQQILEHANESPGLYAPVDLHKCAHDDWFLARFLLRHKLDLAAALELLKRSMRFNNESLAHHLRPTDFPAEFYQLGALFSHGRDRKGNRMLYLRVRLHKRTPEITSALQAFIYYNIKRLDDQAQGRGISIVIDCSGAGLANADMEMLLFIISTLKNYFPKGLSYFLVHELPWILKPFWHLAKAWVPDEHRQLIKFSDSSTILEYIDRDNLPAYLGGRSGQSCNQAPADCTNLEQAAKLWGIDRRTVLSVLAKFREHLPAESVARIEAHFSGPAEEEAGAAHEQA